MGRHAALTLLAAASLYACGGRTPLRMGAHSGDGGAGGGASSSSSSSSSWSGAGGSGGAPVACAALADAGPSVLVFPPADAVPSHARRPALLRTGDARALVAFGLDPVESPGPVPSAIHHAELEAWGAWPGPLGPMHRAGDVGGEDFVVGAPGAGAFGLLFSTGDAAQAPPLDTVRFAPAVGVGQDYSPYPDSFGVAEAGPFQSPRFAAEGSAYLAVAKERPVAGFFQLSVARIPKGSTIDSLYVDSGCGTSPIAAAAARLGDAIVWATSSSAPFQHCLDDDLVPGPPTDVQVARIDPDGSSEGVLAIAGSDPIARIELAPRSDGAWLVWQEDGSSALTPPAIRAARLDLTGAMVAGPVDLVGDGMTLPGGWTAGAVGDALALAWIDALDPGPPTIAVTLFDEALAPGAATGIQPEGWLGFGRLALLGSPAGDSLLLAFSSAGEPGPEEAIEVRRLDCVP